MADANSEFLYSDGSVHYCQFLMNKLQTEHPEIASIIPEEANCYSDMKKVSLFLIAIHSLEM
jgi:hypothetical protein